MNLIVQLTPKRRFSRVLLFSEALRNPHKTQEEGIFSCVFGTKCSGKCTVLWGHARGDQKTYFETNCERCGILLVGHGLNHRNRSENLVESNKEIT